MNYLCALDFRAADNTAVIDWGWRRTGERQWTNGKGDVVQYISSKHQLDGVLDCTLYLGYRWFDNTKLGSPQELRARAKLRNITLIDRLGKVPCQ